MGTLRVSGAGFVRWAEVENQAGSWEEGGPCPCWQCLGVVQPLGVAGCEILRKFWARWEAGEDFCWCCLPARAVLPPTLRGHWGLGFLGRMWFLTVVPGTREGSLHPLVNDSGSLQGLWLAELPGGMGHLEPCEVPVVILACLCFLLSSWEWGWWDGGLTQCPVKTALSVTSLRWSGFCTC